MDLVLGEGGRREEVHTKARRHEAMEGTHFCSAGAKGFGRGEEKRF